jgi:hypothetical protein
MGNNQKDNGAAITRLESWRKTATPNPTQYGNPFYQIRSTRVGWEVTLFPMQSSGDYIESGYHGDLTAAVNVAINKAKGMKTDADRD